MEFLYRQTLEPALNQREKTISTFHSQSLFQDFGLRK